MKKRMLKGTAFCLVALTALAAFSACGRRAGHGKKTDREEPAVTASASTKDTAPLPRVDGDLLACTGWLGRAPEEVGLPNDGTDRYISFTGTLFGAPASGSAFIKKAKDGTLTIDGVNLYLRHADGVDPYCELADLCCGAVASGTEPYVASLGGATMWFDFDTGDARIHLSTASESDVWEFSVDKSNAAGAPYALRFAENVSRNEYAAAEVTVTGAAYDNGVLTLTVKNGTGEPLDYDGEYTVLFGEGDGSYYSLDRLEALGLAMPSGYALAPGEERELRFDLRDYGRPLPGAYKIRFDGNEFFFSLEQKPDTPW